MNRNILIIIAIGIFALLVWQLGLIPFQSYYPQTEVEYLDREDLTDHELDILDPILLEYEEGDFIPDSSPLEIEDIESINRDLTISCSGTHTVEIRTYIEGNKVKRSFDGRPTLPVSCSSGSGTSDWNFLDNQIDTYFVKNSLWSVGIWDYINDDREDIDYSYNDVTTEPGYWTCTVGECSCGYTLIGDTFEPNCECNPGESVRIDSNTIHRCTDDGTIQGYHESDDAWVLEDQPITSGFATYEGVNSGTRVKKTTSLLTANVPKVVETVDFTLPVDVGILDNIDVTAEFRDSGGDVVGTYSGTTPSIQINDLPLRNDGTVHLTASAGSDTQTKSYPVSVEQLRLSVSQPDTYRYGKSFNLGVSFDQITETRPVTVSIYQDGTLFNTYDGTMPSVTINDPKISGDATILVETDYSGTDYTKEFDVRFDDINLVVDEPGYYEYGHTVHLGVDFSQIDVNAPVNVKIYDKNDKLLEEYSGTMPEVELTEPKALSDCRIEVRVDHEGRTYTKSLNAFFTGYPVATSETSKSYVQYEMDNIEFEVTVTDINNIPLTPSSLSNINPICSLSQGTVESSSYVHLGDGLYRITSQVTGMGTFLGKLSFTYMTKDFESDNIEINIRENKISIGTSEFPSMGQRDTPIEGIINVFDAKGERFNPDELKVTVYYPDGYTTETIEKSAMTNEGIGRYTFSYTPTQLEKYSFEVTANSAGITEGTATASVAVASAPGEGDDGRDSMGPIITFFLDNIIFLLIAFAAVFVLIWRFVL